MSVLEGKKPENVLKFFEEIASIPHGSGNVEQISDYLVKFANDRGLKCRQDEKKNLGRNKMEIHVIRRLCRPETYLSLRKCELFTQHVKSLRAVEVHFPIKIGSTLCCRFLLR